MTNHTPIQALLSAMIVSIVLVLPAIADSRYAIADMVHPDAVSIADSRYAITDMVQPAVGIADSRYAIADMVQPDVTTLPMMADPVPTPTGETEPQRHEDTEASMVLGSEFSVPGSQAPAQPVTPEPANEDLSVIGYRLSAINTVYLPLVQRSEKYPPANRAYELEVLRLVNEQRAAAGLWPLVEDAALTQAARRHAQDMAVNHLLSHTGSDGSTYFQRMTEEGFTGTPWTEAAVMARVTPVEAVNAWMGSPLHRDIVLDRTSTHIGMGCAVIATDPYAGTYTWVINLGVLP